MSQFTVIYDANVLYPAPLRDLLIRLAGTGLFRARWTQQIHDEWTRKLLRNRPELSRENIQRTVQLINKSVADCLVEGYEHLVDAIDGMPDPDDRHVLAAAIKAGAELIVTMNLKDFPDSVLSKYGLEAIHPDDFVVDQFDLNAGACLKAVQEMRAALSNPPKTQDELLAILMKQQLPQTVSHLEQYRLAF